MKLIDKVINRLEDIIWKIRVNQLFRVIDPVKNPDATQEQCDKAAEDFIDYFNNGFKEGMNGK